MQFRTGRRHAVTALLGAAGLVAGSGVAVAQMQPNALPGTDDSAIQVSVDSDVATVVVNPAGGLAKEIDGTFTNETNYDLECASVTDIADSAGTVTDEALVDRSLAYLSGNLVPSTGPLGIDTGSLAAQLGSGSLGSLGLGDPAAVELSDIQAAQDRARIDGHYGNIGDFTVEAGETHDWSASLSAPSDGDTRTDFDAAALFTCQQVGGQWYAVAGYEYPDGNSAGGSLDMGSLSSDSLGEGSLGS